MCRAAMFQNYYLMLLYHEMLSWGSLWRHPGTSVICCHLTFERILSNSAADDEGVAERV